MDLYHLLCFICLTLAKAMSNFPERINYSIITPSLTTSGTPRGRNVIDSTDRSIASTIEGSMPAVLGNTNFVTSPSQTTKNVDNRVQIWVEQTTNIDENFIESTENDMVKHSFDDSSSIQDDTSDKLKTTEEVTSKKRKYKTKERQPYRKSNYLLYYIIYLYFLYYLLKTHIS